MKDPTYPTKLKNIGIELLEEFKGAKAHHKIKCCTCKHEWVATPVSKMQTYKKYGVNGCPACKKRRFEHDKKQQLQQDIINLKKRNIILISDVKPGTLHKTTTRVTFKNTKCKNDTRW